MIQKDKPAFGFGEREGNCERGEVEKESEMKIHKEKVKRRPCATTD